MAELSKIDGLTKAERRRPLVRSSYVIPKELKDFVRTEIDKIREDRQRGCWAVYNSLKDDR